MGLNYQGCKEYSMLCMQNKVVPFIKSSPGMGKSSLFKEIAKECNLKFIDYRISCADPSDFNGYPQIVNGVASYIPFDTFPIETTPLPCHMDDQGNPVLDANGNEVKYDGWLILMDELNHGTPVLLRSCYKFILDHKVGNNKLHPRLLKAAAGNLDTDNAQTNKIGTALMSRVVTMFMDTDVKEWLNYATSANFDYRVTSYIQFDNEMLNAFKPDTVEVSFPCQRTWETVSKLIKKIPVLGLEHVDMLAGAIGEGGARKFISYNSVFQKIPSIQDILANPLTAKLPDSSVSPESVYAVTGLVASNMTVANIGVITKYIERLPTEFSVLTFREGIRRKPEIADTEEVSEWLEKNMDHIV